MYKEFEVSVENLVVPAFYYSMRDLGRFFEQGLEPGLPLCIDLETYANPKWEITEKSALIAVKSLIRTLQIYDGNAVHILDFKSSAYNFLESCAESWRQVQDILLAADYLIAHNALFETTQLQKYAYLYGMYKPLNIHCTMNMYRLLSYAMKPYGEDEKIVSDLRTVVFDVLGIELDKESQMSDWSVDELSDDQLHYCALDVITPYFAYGKMWPEIQKIGLEGVFELNNHAQEAIAHMGLYGITVNRKAHTKLIAEWKEQELIKDEECFKILNCEIEDLPPERIYEAVIDGCKEDIKEHLPFETLEFSDSYAVCLRDWAEEALLADAEVTVLLQDYEEEFSKNYGGIEFECDAADEDPKPHLKQLEKEHKARIKPLKSVRTQLRKVIKNIKPLLVDPNSSKQVGEWLERNIPAEDLEDWPRTEKTGALKTDAFSFNEHEHLDIVAPIVQYKKFKKLVSTYGESFASHLIKHPDGTYRLHPNFSLCYTQTGRMSSFEPNIQNIPSKPGVGKAVRKIFIPRPGDRKLVTADFSQIEIRAAAYLSGDEILIRAYDEGVDIHRLTASRTMGKPMEQVTDEERKVSKAPNFALLFLGGAKTLKKYAKKEFGIEMSMDHAYDIVNKFRQAYPRFHEWQLEQAQAAEQNLYVTTPLGKFRMLQSDRYYNISVNHPIQGAAAELMLLSLVFTTEALTSQPELEAYLVNCVHDEITIDCPTKNVDVVKQLMYDSMGKAMSLIFPEATHLKLVGIGVGDNWLEAGESK